MKLSSTRSGLWALLSLLWATNAVAQTPFVMDFEFGFFDGQAPQDPPTEAQLSALVCETQVFFAKALQNATGSNMVTLKALDITSNITNNGTFIMAFETELNTADDSPPPSGNAIVEGLDPDQNPAIDETEYITGYIYEATPLDGSPNYFMNVDSISFRGDFTSDRNTEGALPEAVCEETPAPTQEGKVTTKFCLR